jgi:RNA polymerase sigma-70 factor (ECF subfamily)
LDAERNLVERLRRGEPEAFDTVYEMEKAAIYGFVLRLSRDAHVAADLFQNVWLKLAQHAPQLREDSNLRAWLLTVARREFLSFRRAQVLDLSRLLTLGIEVEEPTPPEDVDLSALAAALDRLADADREVLLLSASGLDAAAVAQAFGISAVAVRQRLARARRRLAGRAARRARAPAAGHSQRSSLMDRELADLNRLLVGAPPPELDALVRERMHGALARARRDGVYPASVDDARRGSSSRSEAPIAIPLPERCLYAASLVVYGVQAAGVLARMVWRSFAG